MLCNKEEDRKGGEGGGKRKGEKEEVLGGRPRGALELPKPKNKKSITHCVELPICAYHVLLYGIMIVCL